MIHSSNKKGIIKKSIILSLLLLFLGCSYFMVSLHTNNIMIRGIPVEIIGEENDAVKRYIENINYVDDYLIKLPSKIILTNQKISQVIHNKEIPTDANAVTIPAEKIIYINTDSYDSMTLIHEFFHLLDAKFNISSSNKFQELMKKNMVYLNLNPYQSSNYNEMFVGCMLRYRYDGENLRKDCLEVYEFLNSIIDKSVKNI